MNNFFHWLKFRVISHNKRNRFQWFASLSIPIFWRKLDFFHLRFNKILRVPPDWKPWLYFFKMFEKVRFFRTNPTNPQCLTKDYRALGVIWIRRCIMEKLVSVCRFNIKVCPILPSDNLILKSKKCMLFLLTFWQNLMLGWKLFKSSKNKVSASLPWVQIKKTSSM